MLENSHDAKRKHTCQRNTLAQRHFDVEEILGRPQKHEKIAEGVLRRVEVVDCFYVQTFRSGNVLEDVPIRACRSTSHVSRQFRLRSVEHLTSTGTE
jgi:hypothetical protein